MNQIFITGAAGFIGSSLADRLLADGKRVVGWDNFSTGQRKFLEGALKNDRFKLVEGDNLDLAALTKAMAGCDTVFHLAANADVRFGLEHPSKDLQQNTVATFNVLEAMRSNGIKRIAFSSTGSVYGEAEKIPTPEDAGFPVQTSLYAASKVAGEGMISSYCEGFKFEGYIFRFVSILGERYTHGHVFDFYKQLLEHPERLKVLGDGTQRKSYLYVQDCLSAMLHVMNLGTAKKAKHGVEIYNLGTDEYVQVNNSIGYICAALKLKPALEYSGGSRGWVGDNPFIFLETKKIRATGWKPALTIEQGIAKTLQWLQQNQWVYEQRHLNNHECPGHRCSSGIGQSLAMDQAALRPSSVPAGAPGAGPGWRCEAAMSPNGRICRSVRGHFWRSQWTHVDGIICCAAIQGPIGPAMEMDPVQWRQTIAANLGRNVPYVAGTLSAALPGAAPRENHLFLRRRFDRTAAEFHGVRCFQDGGPADGGNAGGGVGAKADGHQRDRAGGGVHADDPRGAGGGPGSRGAEGF